MLGIGANGPFYTPWWYRYVRSWRVRMWLGTGVRARD